MRAPPLLAVVALASMWASSGCASGYQYIKNDDIGVYAKVPAGWTVFDEADLFPGASERDLERISQVRWTRTFYGGDDGQGVEASTTRGGPVPAGQVSILAVPPQAREVLDLRTMRGGGDPNADPITLQQQGGSPTGEQYSVVSDEPVSMAGGYSGLHTVYAVAGQGDPYIVDQTVLRSADSSRIVLFTVSCTEQCYSETYKNQIKSLVDSWTIQEVQS
ncbi:MAG TPA: hypothetical protein VH479_25245 [Acidimicrobiales bacterium]|jgi:hypothetical protein